MQDETAPQLEWVPRVDEWGVAKLERIAAEDPAMLARGVKRGILSPDGKVNRDHPAVQVGYTRKVRSASVT